MERDSLVLLVLSFFLFVFGALSFLTITKYYQLRGVYNEVALQVVLDRIPPKGLTQEEVKTIRVAVEDSNPKFNKEKQVVDLGFFKDSSGTWRTAQ